MKKIKIRFPKGITTVRLPFTADMGSYAQLYRQIERVEYPKTTRRIEAQLLVSIDLKDGSTSFNIAEVLIKM